MRRLAKKEKLDQRIAVVEETADNIYSVKFILQSLGYSVGSFSFKAPRLSLLLEFEPQLVIVDMMIPERGAYDAIRRIRRSRIGQVPILAITAEAMEGNDEEVFEAGGQDVLAKPYSIGDLQKKLDKWLCPATGLAKDI
ncbi:MAG: response regulator [Acidobacteriota bacterium]